MASASSHGRVNLIGEHTDYNDGWVLPTLIQQRTDVELRRRESSDSDRLVKVVSHFEGGHTETLSYELGKETKQSSWIDYIQGASVELRKRGLSLEGFDLDIRSSVPIGSGLSSSAALETALLRALREAFQLPLTDLEIAKIGQAIENNFVGANVGILDQMACGLGKFGSALFLDTLEMKSELVALPEHLFDLIVINSGVVHQHAGGDYNKRRSECQEACRSLGIHHLRALELNEIEKLNALPETLKKRARHIVTENARVHEAVAAIRKGDIAKLGALFTASHVSMRDDYEISVEPVDDLVNLLNAHEDVFGARMTGGGFGGCVIALASPSKGRVVAVDVLQAYDHTGGRRGTIVSPL